MNEQSLPTAKCFIYTVFTQSQSYFKNTRVHGFSRDSVTTNIFGLIGHRGQQVLILGDI